MSKYNCDLYIIKTNEIFYRMHFGGFHITKKRNIKFAKQLFIKRMDVVNIKTFGIITAENPDGRQLSVSDNKIEENIAKIMEERGEDHDRILERAILGGYSNQYYTKHVNSGFEFLSECF